MSKSTPSMANAEDGNPKRHLPGTGSGLILSTQQDIDAGTVAINAALRRQALGSENDGLCEGLVDQIVQMTAVNGKINLKTLHFAAGALMEISPRNGVESLLAVQIVCNHILAMKMARMTVAADTVERMEKLEAMSTKMMRTATTQMEALHKLRNGGKQKVKVEHVHIHEGGQAVIGNVETGGRLNETGRQSHAFSTAMHRDLEAIGVPMQGPGCER